MLKCVTIYETDRLQNDLEMVCWTGSHLLWALAFAIPVIAICFSFPAIGVFWMIINKKRL